MKFPPAILALLEVHQQGKRPRTKVIAAALDAAGLSRPARKKRRRPERGRVAHAALHLWMQVAKGRLLFKHAGVEKPYEEAVKAVAAKHRTTPAALKRRIRRGLAAVPELRVGPLALPPAKELEDKQCVEMNLSFAREEFPEFAYLWNPTGGQDSPPKQSVG